MEVICHKDLKCNLEYLEKFKIPRGAIRAALDASVTKRWPHVQSAASALLILASSCVFLKPSSHFHPCRLLPSLLLLLLLLQHKETSTLSLCVPSSGTSISAPSLFFLTSLSTSESPCLSLPSFIHTDILNTAVKVGSSLNHRVKRERKYKKKGQHTMKTSSQQLFYMCSCPSCSSEKGKKTEGSFTYERACLSVSVEEIRGGRVRK